MQSFVRITCRYTGAIYFLQVSSYNLHHPYRMETVLATRRVGIGPVGHTVRSKIAKIRNRKELTLRDLSERLSDIRPMGHSTLSEIEHGARRVDVDDLVALASALGVSPTELLGIELEVPTWAMRPVSKGVEEMIHVLIDADQKASNGNS